MFCSEKDTKLGTTFSTDATRHLPAIDFRLQIFFSLSLCRDFGRFDD